MCNNCDITPAITPEEPKGRKESRVPPTPVDSDAVTVFRGGAVYTCDPQRPWAEAVVVRGHEIVAVGSDSEVCAAAGDEAHIIDLGGRMIVPGFVEGHIHPLLGGFLASGVDLQVPTREEALAAIANYARNNPDGPVRGFGWRVDMFGPGGPHRRELDGGGAERGRNSERLEGAIHSNRPNQHWSESDRFGHAAEHGEHGIKRDSGGRVIGASTGTSGTHRTIPAEHKV